MRSKIENGKAIFYVEGRVDSTNAPTLEEEINAAIGDTVLESVVLDFDALEYMSSAGLRVVLRLKQKYADTKIVNASLEVYSVLEMTGFTEMMDVEKALRKVDITGLEVIGRGANGEVCRIDSDTIIKVYHNPDALQDIKNEQEMARQAFIMGVPTAISYDTVRVGDGYGSVFELLNATSLTKVAIRQPELLDGYIAKYVDLLKIIHRTKVNTDIIPPISNTIDKWIIQLKDMVPEDTWNKVRKLIDEVPESDHMIHGDYHAKNVMFQGDETLLIDMDTVSYGNPVFEFGPIYNACIGYFELNHDDVEDFQGYSYEISEKIWNTTLRLYFGTDDEKLLAEANEKAALLGIIRIIRSGLIRKDTSENGQIKRDHYRNRIVELADKIDSLAFSSELMANANI